MIPVLSGHGRMDRVQHQQTSTGGRHRRTGGVGPGLILARRVKTDGKDRS